MDTSPVIQLDNLSTRFGENVIHDGLSLGIFPEKITAIVGGSGAGKTTLLRAILGLQPIASGQITVLGQSLSALSGRAKTALYTQIGVMFQQGALFSSLSIFDNIAFPMRRYRAFDTDLLADLVRLKLSLVGLSPAVADLFPAELSGGMMKRAAIARALALDPAILFLDEPTAGLDPEAANEIDDLVRLLTDTLHLTVVMVTHDLDTLWKISDTVVFLADKKIAATGTMAELSASLHTDVQAYFRSARAMRYFEAAGS